ncbi:MAG: RNA polymerase sigma factor [Planctomycetota bacterium]|jgi:RNA polymerase sigma-70 factor (ECF subfamily)
MHRGDPRQPGQDGEALTHAFLALRDRLLGTAYFVLGHREDAREAVQEAFLKCWRKRAEVRQSGNLNAWIFTVVLNSAKDQRRRRRVRRAEPLPGNESMLPSTREQGPPAAAAKHELLARMRAAILELPETEREVFLLRQNGDLTYAAIADALGAPVGTMKTRMRSALRRLREILDPSPRPGAATRREPGR